MGLRGPRRRSSFPVGLILILLGLTAATATHAGPTGLSSTGFRMAPVGMRATPPTMGWNSWNSFGSRGLTETLARETADAMANGGLLAAGYDTLTLDDCWSAVSRDASGNLTNDPAKFPSGMKAVGDYIHSRGLKYGIYASIGTTTCSGGTPGSLDHEYQDVAQFASWGVDYIKADRCNADGLVMKDIYARWRGAIIASGRSIVLSASDNNPTDEPWAWGPLTAGQWRISPDISDDWTSPPGQPSWKEGMIDIFDRNFAHAAATAPGTFNDPDMLEVGNGGMTATEYRTHFGLWALMSAPLIAGNDVRSMSDATRTILTNPEVIAVDQDAFGFQAILAADSGTGLQVWYKPLAASGTRAVGLLNRGDAAATITVSWDSIQLAAANATVRDLWARADRGSFANGYGVDVPAHGMALLRIVGTDPPATNGFLSDQPWTYMANEQGPVERNSSNGGGGAGDGRPLTLNGVPSLRGFGAHAPSAIEFRPDGACQSFTADVGVDDEVGTLGSVLFQVWGDGQKLYEGRAMNGETPTENVNVSIAGTRSLRLQIVSVDSTADDHADWANPRIACADRSPPNQPPQARFTTTRSLVAPWEIVAFDAESSTDPDGTIVSYMWDFGDGFTANGILVRHAYVHSGRFSVVLTVVDNSQTSTTATSEMTVDVPPIAAFSTSLNTAPPGLPILFDASASMDSDGTIVSYAWDFGDGQTGAGVSVTHAYANNGTFTVRLAVADDLGAVDNVAGSIGIGNRRPSIVSASPQASIVLGPGDAETLVVVASDPDGDLLTYSWLVDRLPVGGSSSVDVFHGSSVGTRVVPGLLSGGRRAAAFSWTVEVRALPQPPTGHLEPVGEGLFVQVLSPSALVALGVILLLQNLRRRRP